MAIMENMSTGERIFLKSHHVFGRNKEKSDTVLSSREISQIHASVRWNGWDWTLTDLSRNGVWLEGVRIVPGKNTVLQQGNVIRFSSTAHETEFRLIDQKAPATLLIPLKSQDPEIELDRFYVLPDETNPDIFIYISQDGQWVYETDSGMFPLNNGAMIHHNQESWRFFCAEPVDATYFRKTKKSIRFQFFVSADEEHVVVKIEHGETLIDLGERAHHYMLLTLARARFKDAKAGDDPETQGWIELDHLAAMLGLDQGHMNIQIFRIRKQISAALPNHVSLPQVVERRLGGLRFGYSDFQIIRESTVEGTLMGGKAV